MDAAQKIGIATAAGIAAIGIAVASSGGESKPSPSCTFSVGDAGTFEVGDDSKRCDLVFERPRMRTCHLQPVDDSSIKYQWSYEITPTGVIVRGLEKGAHVAFECKE